MLKVRKNLTDMKFGKLTVIKQVEDYISRQGIHYSKWLCKCDCGNQIDVTTRSLMSGNTKSCGCLNKELVVARNKQNIKNNLYDLSGEYGIGYTSKGEQFYFDLEDYDKIKDYCWYIDKYGYVKSWVRGNSYNCSKRKFILMHNLIMGYLYIDHKNHKKNDNRRNNLRLATSSQNNMNISIQSNNTSGVTGVCFEKCSTKWIAYITINRKQIKLGRFDNKDDAIKARKEAEEKYFGEWSYDNSIKSDEE